MKNWNGQEKGSRKHCSGLDPPDVWTVIRESKYSIFGCALLKRIITEKMSLKKLQAAGIMHLVPKNPLPTNF